MVLRNSMGEKYMKRFVKTAIAAASVIAAAASISIYASAQSISYSAQIDIEGHAGYIYGGADVMLVLKNADGDVVYINQSKVDDKGNYSFRGKISEDNAGGCTAIVNYNGSNINDTVTEAKTFNQLYKVNIDLEENDGTVISDVTIDKRFADIKEVTSETVWLACYDENNVLKGVISQNGNLTKNVIKDKLPEGTKYIKCMVWDNSSKQIPLAEVKERAAAQQISCWGDSITMCYNSALHEYVPNWEKINGGNEYFSYPDVLRYLSGHTVNNYGVGGENAATIAGRQGGVPMLVKAVDIPSETEPVKITLYAENGERIYPFMQGSNAIAKLNPCTINGVKGEITVKQEDDGYFYYPNEGKNYQYYFTRSEAGEAAYAEDGTPVISAAATENNGDVNVIFIGTNGGFGGTVSGLTRIIDAMVNHLKSEGREYIVVGLLHGDSDDSEGNNTAKYEEIMQEKYGERFIPLYSLFRKDARKTMEKYNIPVTAEDEKRMSQNLPPMSFLAAAGGGEDTVHLSAVGTYILGSEVYSKMLELGILTEVTE